MITEADISYVFERDSLQGAPLVFVIDTECVYDFVVNSYGVDLFTNNKGISDISNEYPDHDGITVKIIKENDDFEIFQTSEYFGSILLSNYIAVSAVDYPYGHHVLSPNAKFDGERFIIKNASVASLYPWHPKNPNSPHYVAP